MPELLGFKEKNGQIVAIVDYPDARKFVLKPKARPAETAKENGEKQ